MNNTALTILASIQAATRIIDLLLNEAERAGKSGTISDDEMAEIAAQANASDERIDEYAARVRAELAGREDGVGDTSGGGDSGGGGGDTSGGGGGG